MNTAFYPAWLPTPPPRGTAMQSPSERATVIDLRDYRQQREAQAPPTGRTVIYVGRLFPRAVVTDTPEPPRAA